MSETRVWLESARLDLDSAIAVPRMNDAKKLNAFRLQGLAGLADAPVLQIALCAVIEEVDGRLSYWALRHRPDKADFHDPVGFAIELDARRPVNIES